MTEMSFDASLPCEASLALWAWELLGRWRTGFLRVLVRSQMSLEGTLLPAVDVADIAGQSLRFSRHFYDCRGRKGSSGMLVVISSSPTAGFSQLCREGGGCHARGIVSISRAKCYLTIAPQPWCPHGCIALSDMVLELLSPWRVRMQEARGPRGVRSVRRRFVSSLRQVGPPQHRHAPY